MQTATDLINTVTNRMTQPLAVPAQLRSESENRSSQSMASMELAMVELWDKMGHLFGAKWLRQYGDSTGEAFDTWSRYLADLSAGQIKTGFENLLKFKPKFIPDAVEFREYCESMASFGLPDAEKAYREAAGNCHQWKTHRFSHPAVIKALMETGIATMREFPESKSKPVYLRNYQILCRRVMAGETLDAQIPKAIPQHIGRLCTRQENIDRMAQLRAATGI